MGACSLRAICKNCSTELSLPLTKVTLELSQSLIQFTCNNCKQVNSYGEVPEEITNRLYRNKDTKVIFIPLGSDLETKPTNLTPLTFNDIIDLHFELVKDS